MDKFELLDYLLAQKQATSILVDFIASIPEDDAYGFLYLLADVLGLDLNLDEESMLQ